MENESHQMACGNLADECLHRTVDACWVLKRHHEIVESVWLPSRKAIQQLCKVRNKEDAVAFEFAEIRLFLGDNKTCTFPTTAAVFIELATREGFAPERPAKEYFEHAEGIDQAGKSVEYKLLD